MLLRAFEELWHLRAFAQLHVGLLPVRSAAGESSLALDLPVRDARPNAFDLRAEELLHGTFDLHLVGVARHLEDDRPPVFAQDRGLLGDQRASDDVSEIHGSRSAAAVALQGAQHLYASASCNFSKAPCVVTTRLASTTSRAVSRELGTNDTPGIFRIDSASFSSGVTSTSTALPSQPRRFRSSVAALVLTSLAASVSTTTSAPSLTFVASAARRAPRSTFLESLKS